MAEPAPYRDSKSDTGDETRPTTDGGFAGAGTPLWVKVFGIVFIVLVVLFGILHFAGGGPGMHSRPIEHGVRQP